MAIGRAVEKNKNVEMPSSSEIEKLLKKTPKECTQREKDMFLLWNDLGLYSLDKQHLPAFDRGNYDCWHQFTSSDESWSITVFDYYGKKEDAAVGSAVPPGLGEPKKKKLKKCVGREREQMIEDYWQRKVRITKDRECPRKHELRMEWWKFLKTEDMNNPWTGQRKAKPSITPEGSESVKAVSTKFGGITNVCAFLPSFLPSMGMPPLSIPSQSSTTSSHTSSLFSTPSPQFKKDEDMALLLETQRKDGMEMTELLKKQEKLLAVRRPVQMIGGERWSVNPETLEMERQYEEL